MAKRCLCSALGFKALQALHQLQDLRELGSLVGTCRGCWGWGTGQAGPPRLSTPRVARRPSGGPAWLEKCERRGARVEQKKKKQWRSNTEVLAPARPSHRRAAESGGLDNVLGAAAGRESPESARVGNNSEAVPARRGPRPRGACAHRPPSGSPRERGS